MPVTTFKFEPGDVFFCRGRGIPDRIINLFQSRTDSENNATCSHCGVVIDKDANTIETTPWKTEHLNLGANYAGSNLVVFRRKINQEEFKQGYACIQDQMGRIYPYWRLIIQALGLAKWIHFKSMECCALSAHFIKGSGYNLKQNPWSYNTEKLHDELEQDSNWIKIFEGSQRAQGYII